MNYYNMSKQQALEETQSSEDLGLTAQEAADRLSKYGANALAQAKRKSIIIKFLEQFTVIMNYSAVDYFYCAR